jgi:hypothetical protein
MTSDQKNVRPREVVPAPISAGGIHGHPEEVARTLLGLPFDPHDFVVGPELKKALEEISVENTLNDLQAFDRRTTAAPYYERRIKELAEPAEEE